MDKKIISTTAAPAAIGPYSQAVMAGDFLYVSGQIPLDPATGELAAADIETQTEQSLKNIGAILSEAGMTYDNVVKTTVFLADINDFSAMNEVYAKFFTGDCPARAAIQVAAIPRGARVEIEAIAVR